jgi:hypothetical protein
MALADVAVEIVGDRLAEFASAPLWSMRRPDPECVLTYDRTTTGEEHP